MLFSSSGLSGFRQNWRRRPVVADLPPLSLLRELLDCIAMYVVVLDRNGITLWSNTRPGDFAQRQLHWWGLGGTVGECYLQPFRIAALDGDGHAAKALAGMQEVLRGRDPAYSMEYPCRRADGACWYRLQATALADGQGAILTLEEITRTKRMKQALQHCRARLRRQDSAPGRQAGDAGPARPTRFGGPLPTDNGMHQAASVFSNSSEAMIITDARRRIVRFNDALLEITGFATEDVLGKDLQVLQAEIHEPAFTRTIWQALEREDHWQGEIWNRRRSGEPFPAWQTIDAVRDDQGRLDHYVCLFSDISSIKAAHTRLYHLAHHDSLTGLANRLLFWARLEQSIEHARRQRQGVALLFLDLDRFKQVNDSHGHKVGDRLLQAVAKRLMGQVRGEDTVARLGGDEFAVIATGVSDSRAAKTLACKLSSVVAEPLAIQGSHFEPSASIGIALFPDQAKDVEGLYQAADAAMYRVKRARRSTLD